MSSQYLVGQEPAHDPTPASDAAVSGGGVRRGWAWVGVAAGIASIAGIQLSMSLSPVYDEANPPTPESILLHLSGRIPQLLAFHVVTVVAALLVLVFAAGLKRRLDAQAPAGSLLPALSGTGLTIVSVMMILGTGLNTEFTFGLSQPDLMIASDVSFYSHWIATIEWLWLTAGVSAIAVGLAALRGAAPRWLGVTSLVLGVLTTLLGISPLQYLAGFVGPVWLLVAALGFALGDRRRS
ncbi:hypothetical protein [Auraticoccus monumenti]|uniref:DUF4386 family protein n=1 Tax=Auraticoccus monumenti TaxID=675864 RepID=A0A1G7C3S3_9ACTN|nr:hypothetical protein [Auraticoccus monumenti]SDE33913.1 hypothetical protein SAMN04489747_3153 [Auraticoccus monumenti]